MLSKRGKTNKGISTIELIVTIAIFVMITTSILVSYPQLSSQLSLEKTTQDIASTLHETRMYGIGVRSFGDTGAGVVRTKGYGVHFDGASNKTYTLFSDVNEDHKYDPAAEKVSEFKINGTETIGDVCVIRSSDNTTGDAMCASSGLCLSSGSINTVDILFARPAPSVFINGFNADGTVCPGSLGRETCGRAIVVIKSPRGSCKKIEVWTTGQVSIQAKATP